MQNTIKGLMVFTLLTALLFAFLIGDCNGVRNTAKREATKTKLFYGYVELHSAFNQGFSGSLNKLAGEIKSFEAFQIRETWQFEEEFSNGDLFMFTKNGTDKTSELLLILVWEKERRDSLNLVGIKGAVEFTLWGVPESEFQDWLLDADRNIITLQENYSEYH